MLYIDIYEVKSGLPSEINKYLPKSEMKIMHLESGDICFGDVGIERKAMSDLMHTLFMKQKEGGRLWRQLDTLKRTYKQPFLLIEGPVDYSEPVLAGTLNSIHLFSSVKIIHTDNIKQTGIELVKLYNKYGTARSGLPPPPAVVRGKTVKEIRWGMLQSVRGVGPNAAKKIMDEVPTLFTCISKGVMYDDKLRQQLSKIKGIKKEAKEMIVKVFTE